jgi:hypothetical protein
MLSKNRTYLLVIVLAIAVGAYLLLTYTQNKERNFRTGLIDFDTTLVNRIEIAPPSPAEKIILLKDSDSWRVKKANNSYAADIGSIKNLMLQLDGSEIKNVAANTSSDWDKFKTTDVQGTRVRFLNNSKILSDIILGKFEYIQPESQQQANPYMRQPQGEMLTYARIAGEDNVYTIDGMISLGMGKKADDYRDKKVTSLTYDNLNELSFDYTDEKAFKLVKREGKWYIDQAEADSAITGKYLRSIINLAGKAFYNTEIQNEHHSSKLTILQSTGDIIEIKAFEIDTSSVVITSSLNPTNSILDKDKKLAEKLFVNQAYLIGNHK